MRCLWVRIKVKKIIMMVTVGVLCDRCVTVWAKSRLKSIFLQNSLANEEQ